MASEGFADKQQSWQESNTPGNLLYSPEERHYRLHGSRGTTEQRDIFPYIPELWKLFIRYRKKALQFFNDLKIIFN